MGKIKKVFMRDFWGQEVQRMLEMGIRPGGKARGKHSQDWQGHTLCNALDLERLWNAVESTKAFLTGVTASVPKFSSHPWYDPLSGF